MPSAAIRSPGRTTTTSPTVERVGRRSRPPRRRGGRGRSGAVFEELLDRPLRALEGERFEALADQGDEDDLGGDEVFAQQGRRHAGDRQRDVGADPPFEQRRQGEVDDPAAADHRRRQRQRDPERPAVLPAPGREDQVEPEQEADHHRRRHQHPPLGVVVVLVVVMMADRHLGGVVFAMQRRMPLGVSSAGCATGVKLTRPEPRVKERPPGLDRDATR